MLLDLLATIGWPSACPTPDADTMITCASGVNDCWIMGAAPSRMICRNRAFMCPWPTAGVPPRGFEPLISTLKGWRPRPLDDGGGCQVYPRPRFGPSEAPTV